MEFCETPDESFITVNELVSLNTSASVDESVDETIYNEADQSEEIQEPDTSGSASVTVVYTGRHLKETFTRVKSNSGHGYSKIQSKANIIGSASKILSLLNHCVRA